jgi:hypothetical protein
MAKDSLAQVEDFKALAPQTEGFTIKEVMKVNFPRGISQNNLQRVKVPSGGAVSWEINTIEGEQSVKEIVGIIVATREVRAYYDKPYDGSNEPPACYSPDGVNGHGEPGGPCANCPLSKWGSDENQRGQACQLRRMMLILPEDNILPLVISAPPGSLKNVEDYFGGLSGQMLPHFAVVTSLKLEKDKNPAGIAYSRIAPSYVRKLRADEIDSLREYMTVVLPAFQTMSAVDEPAEPQDNDKPY